MIDSAEYKLNLVPMLHLGQIEKTLSVLAFNVFLSVFQT